MRCSGSSQLGAEHRHEPARVGGEGGVHAVQGTGRAYAPRRGRRRRDGVARAPHRPTWSSDRGRASGRRTDLVGTRYDPDLLRDGDRRNVVDRTGTGRSRRSSPTSTPGAPACTWRSRTGRTTSTSARSSGPRTPFNAAGVHVVGGRRWNRRGAMVTDRYLHVHHHPDAAALARLGRRRGVASADRPRQPAGRRCRWRPYDLPRALRPAARSGGGGLAPRLARPVRRVLHIAQFGSTRSLNAGAAAAIALHAWVRRWPSSPATGLTARHDDGMADQSERGRVHEARGLARRPTRWTTRPCPRWEGS